jgi:hypothetical protein
MNWRCFNSQILQSIYNGATQQSEMIDGQKSITNQYEHVGNTFRRVRFPADVLPSLRIPMLHYMTLV